MTQRRRQGDCVVGYLTGVVIRASAAAGVCALCEVGRAQLDVRRGSAGIR